MIYFLLCFSLFCFIFKLTPRGKRDAVVIFTICVYFFLICLNQLYLENYLFQSFNVSDPIEYYLVVHDLDYSEILGLMKDENVYFLINWFNSLFFSEPSYNSITLKFGNFFVFISIYLLITHKIKNVHALEYIMLFHPYVLFIVIRNVRDFHIFFLLVSCCLLLMSTISKKKLMIPYILLIGLMYLFRPFYCLLLLLLGFIRLYKDTIYKKATFFLLLFVSIIFLLVFREQIIRQFASSFLSVLNLAGESNAESREALTAAMQSSSLSFSLIIDFIPRWLIACVSFLFTPHPVSFFNDYLKYSVDHLYSIYTTFDVFLIVIGGCINYLVIYPLLFHCFFIRKHIIPYYQTVFLYTLFMYSVFLLGVADIRIRYIFVLFIILSLLHKRGSSFRFVQIKPVSYVLSLFIFIGLILIKG